MKAVQKTKIVVHYLRSEAIDKKLYHFTFSKDGMLMNYLPLFAGSSIDGSDTTLHIGVWKSENDIELQWVSNIVDRLGYHDAIIEVYDSKIEEVKPSKKKSK